MLAASVMDDSAIEGGRGMTVLYNIIISTTKTHQTNVTHFLNVVDCVGRLHFKRNPSVLLARVGKRPSHHEDKGQGGRCVPDNQTFKLAVGVS